MPPKKSNKNTTYFEEYGKSLTEKIKDYQAQRMTSHDLFSRQEVALFDVMEASITAHPLRDYQMNALYVLDYLLDLPPNKPQKKKLIETIDEETKTEAPFLGYEMATGSGKTMLMGASIYYIHKRFGINHFLIITPPSTDIYQKTIRNFSTNNFESVWSDSAPFSYNLITGDNYTEQLLYNPNADFTIFVFNISKFGSNARNTGYVWESSVWKNDTGNTISIREFLEDKKLVIITDEAHHAQSTISKKIIKSFHPSAVLEYTATAIEQKEEAKRAQTIVYKYDIRQFLKDRHGKLVRAVALNVDDLKGLKKDKETVSDAEKLKLITLVLIHLLKTKAILKDEKSRGLKPIAFVKVKNDTIYTEKVFKYLREELPEDCDNVEIIIEKLKAQDLEITNLVLEMFEKDFHGNISELCAAIRKTVETSIFYHGKSDKETTKKWENIRKNDVEIVVYMQRLDEGIDLPNIYSMAVINDTDTDFKTSVKQIIGRGVRLNKDKRDYDDSPDKLLAQTEMLHIICDKGKNFEEVIAAIQKEFGLNDKYLSFERGRINITNKAKKSLLEGRYLPHLRADLEVVPGVSLIELIKDADKVVGEYIKHNCFFKPENGETRPYLKYRPETFFVEIDVFAEEKIYHEQMQNAGAKPAVLNLDEKQYQHIYGIVMKNLFCLPDTRNTRQIFRQYIDKLNEVQLQFYKIDDVDIKLAQSTLVNTFSFFYRNYIEKHYYQLSFRQIDERDQWSLKNQFNDADILISEDQKENKTLSKELDRKKLTDLIDKGYQFHGYEKGVYDYVKFDTYTEKQFADYANEVLKPENIEDRPFWVKNDRNIFFTYGRKKYYPDFIMFYKGIIYVVETKGELYSDTKKNLLLEKLNDVAGYKSVLVYSDFLDKQDISELNFESFVNVAQSDADRRQTKESLIQEVAEEDKFKKYIPVYSPENAFRKFSKSASKVKLEGWFKVPFKEEGYPESYFVTQIRGEALSPEINSFEWRVFDSDVSPKESIGKIILIHHKDIDDGYPGNLTIRKFSIEEQKTTMLFNSLKIVLSPLNSEYESIFLENIQSDNEIKIVGKLVEGLI